METKTFASAQRIYSPRPPDGARLRAAQRNYSHSRRRSATLWTDRLFWIALSRAWSRWRHILLLVQPDTVVRWHRTVFRRFWTWRSRRPPGRPPTDRDVRVLVRRIALPSPLWGAPRIHGELSRTAALNTVTVGCTAIFIVLREIPAEIWGLRGAAATCDADSADHRLLRRAQSSSTRASPRLTSSASSPSVGAPSIA